MKKLDLLKTVKLVLLSVAISIIFIGCGEEAEFKGTSSNDKIIISLNSITCVTGTPSATDIEGYETLLSDDVLVKDEDNTTIAIYNDEDGLKKVCLVNGSAHIER